MKDRSWGCSVTRTCLKNTVIDPVGVQERSQDVSLTSSKRTTGQAEAMPTATIDQPVTTKEGVDALNTLMLRKLAKESFLSGIPRRVGESGEAHCQKKASTWETLREARSTAISCKCGSHIGKELIPTVPSHHSNTANTETTKNIPMSLDGGKVGEGVGSLLSRIGLDSRKKLELDLPVPQNGSRFDTILQQRTFNSSQDFLKFVPSKDAGECQDAATHSSTIPAEQVVLGTNMVTDSTGKSTSHCCTNDKLSVEHSGTASKEGAVRERSKHVSWAKEISVSMSSAGRSYDKDNELQLFSESGLTEGAQTRMLGRIVDANEIITNPQASDYTGSMHSVGHMWCIPEANSMADAMDTESSPSHRSSATGPYEAAASSRNPACPSSTHDDFEDRASQESCLIFPVHKEAAIQAVVNLSSHRDASTNNMQLQTDETGDLYSSRRKQLTDSPVVEKALIKKIVRDVPEETDSSKISWPLGLKAAAQVRWNLRDLMQRDEIEEDVDANLSALRTTCLPKQVSEELGCRVEELARRLLEKRIDTKQEESVGGRGTPQRFELDVAKLKQDVPQRDVSCKSTKAEPDCISRSQVTEQRIVPRVQLLEEKIARRANHVHTSRPADNDRNGDIDDEEYKHFRGNESSTDPTKLVNSHDHPRDNSAGVRELEVNPGPGRDDLEVLLEFLTMKQKLKENKQTSVEVVVQTEAIVRELLSRMKLDSEYSSSVDSDASVCFLPKAQAVLDDGYSEGGTTRNSALSTMVRNGSIETDVSEPDHKEVFAQANERVYSRSRSANRQTPYVVPSSSKPQRTTGSSSTRKSCSRHCCDLSEEYRVAASSPSRNLDEARRRSKRSSAGAHPTESRSNINRNVNLPVQKHVIAGAIQREEVVDVRTQSKGGSSTRASDITKLLDSADGITISGDAPQGSPAMRSHSARNSESRSFAINSPARAQSNYQLLYNAHLASPVRRTVPKSPSRPCRESPTRRSSPNNRPSPQRQQQRPRSTFTCQLPGSPLKPTNRIEISPYTRLTSPSHDEDIFPAGISEAVVQQSIALAKDSSDPYADFRDSMLEMMQEKNLWQREEELQDLLQCFLHLNQPVHHQLIRQAFSDVVSFGSPMRYHHKSKHRSSKANPSRHRSSPSRSSPSRQLWDVSQPGASPGKLRKGG